MCVFVRVRGKGGREAGMTEGVMHLRRCWHPMQKSVEICRAGRLAGRLLGGWMGRGGEEEE